MTPRASVLAAASPVTTEAVCRTVADYLRIDARTIGLQTPLSAYGLDSLGALELVAHLEDAFGCALPESLLSEWPDVVTVTAALQASVAGRAGVPLDDDSSSRQRVRLLADTSIADDLLPEPSEPPQTDQVLLTGATGFLGAWLTRSAIDAGLHPVCLVRPVSGTFPARRVAANLDQYGLWRRGDERRLTAVAGDITHEWLGLSPPEYGRLARSIGAVYHAAADVNWTLAYDALRTANVVSTRHLLRFSCTHVTKPFHFVSSLSVCFADRGPTSIGERDTMLEHVEHLPLGYAQSKCVAEELVRRVAARGLPARIYRPALLAGDSVSGASNLDDLTAALVKGCIQMGTAPDLDWLFDAIPVDVAARAILAPGRSAQAGVETLHLRHPRPRHWRECVLWTNLFGYDVRLEPYQEWLQRLAREAITPAHPLFRLRAFFSRRIDGRTVPEIYAGHSTSAVDCATARRVEQDHGLGYPAFDADRLETYFEHYMARGFLMPPVDRVTGATADTDAPHVDASAADTHPNREADAIARFTPILCTFFDDPSLSIRALELQQRGSDHSIVNELTAWKRRHATGLFRYRASVEQAGSLRHLELFAKVKPADADVLAVAETVARTCDARVHAELLKVRDHLGISSGQRRELEIYRLQRDARLRAHMPLFYGAWHDEPSASCGLLLEQLTGMVVLDSADGTGSWSEPCVCAAIDGLAAIHGAGAAHAAWLSAQDWIGTVPSRPHAAQMAAFWEALATHATPLFTACAGDALPRLHQQLITTLDSWWQPLDAMPRTLIHHDFNSRNIGIRQTPDGLRLVAYDWELATIGAPQRDLAELLCFVLPPDVDPGIPARLVERHRQALERESGCRAPRDAWAAGFRSALADFLVSRLAFYALVHRIRPQGFLPRVVRTWTRLWEISP